MQGGDTTMKSKYREMITARRKCREEMRTREKYSTQRGSRTVETKTRERNSLGSNSADGDRACVCVRARVSAS